MIEKRFAASRAENLNQPHHHLELVKCALRVSAGQKELQALIGVRAAGIPSRHRSA